MQLHAHLISWACRQRHERAPVEGYQNELRVLYTANRPDQAKKTKSTRYISNTRERILDAPDLLDDYYLNLIDWSDQNVLAIALAHTRESAPSVHASGPSCARESAPSARIPGPSSGPISTPISAATLGKCRTNYLPQCVF